MHSYMFIIMIADSRYYYNNILDAKMIVIYIYIYIYICIITNTHISFVSFAKRELAHAIIYAHPWMPSRTTFGYQYIKTDGL